MVRYLASLVIFLGGIILAITFAGANVLAFADLPSFVLVGIFPFLFISILYGFKETSQAFSMPFKKESSQDNLAKAVVFFQKYGKTTWLAGLIGVIIGVITMFANLDDKAMIGPAVALALVSLLYSTLINVLVITPFLLLLKKQITTQH